MYILILMINSWMLLSAKIKKPIAFFSIRPIKLQHKFTTIQKELLSVVEFINQFRGILFGYEINLFSYHKNLVYSATLSEYQRVIWWKLILGQFVPNIQHIAGFDNILADKLIRLPYTPVNKYYTITVKDHCCENQLFALGRDKNNKFCFPLTLLNVEIEQQKELRDINSKPNAYLTDRVFCYSRQVLDNVELIFYNSKIYVSQNLIKRVIDWQRIYLNPPSGSRLAKYNLGIMLM